MPGADSLNFAANLSNLQLNTLLVSSATRVEAVPVKATLVPSAETAKCCSTVQEEASKNDGDSFTTAAAPPAVTSDTTGPAPVIPIAGATGSEHP